MKIPPKPVVLCILDGWGHREETDHNAIAAAHTPHWDRLWRDYPHGLLNASEHEVGLPSGQMGNSEVGHMNIGAGRIVMQDLPRIDHAISDGTLAQSPALAHFIAGLKQSGGDCHLMGLLSDGGVHAHLNHILALAHIVADAGITVWIHAFLDGRDTPPRSAETYLAQLMASLAASPSMKVATLSGRYYAMDRDKRWNRVKQAYDAIVNASGMRVAAPLDVIHQSYANKLSDEFVVPTTVGNYSGMKEGDGLLMANFRADRARQILTALLDPAFSCFKRERTVSFAATLGMVDYSEALNPMIPSLFAPQSLHDLLGEVVAGAGLTQLRIAETEKYAHVTFFFSGGREEPFTGETRILVPSPQVATYDLQPEMSAYEVTDQLVKAIVGNTYDLIVVNYANTDMVGHSGDLEAARKAVEAVDRCLGRLMEALEHANGCMVVTADHGNAEQMHDHETGQSHTAHTLNLVPVVIFNAHERVSATNLLATTGKLADIAPTLLELMQLPIPAAMTGHSLISSAPHSQMLHG